MTGGLNLGAPGVYRSPDRVEFGLAPIRLDIAGFVGVALRGPVNTPIRVDNWTDYQRAFGGFEAPDTGGPYRLLPYAVEAFFAQGGARAYVVRVAPAGPNTGRDEAAESATTRLRLGPCELAAADEGSWGNDLNVWLDFDVAQSMSVTSETLGLRLPPGVEVPIGSLLRLRAPGLPPAGVMRWVENVVQPEASGSLVAVVNGELPPGVAFYCAVITGTLHADDGDETIDRAETFSGLGLDPVHPKFVYHAVAPRPGHVWSDPNEVPSSRLIRPLGV